MFNCQEILFSGVVCVNVCLVNSFMDVFYLEDDEYNYISFLTKTGFYYYRPHPKDDGRLYFQSVHTWGGSQVQVQVGGSQVQVGGSQVQVGGSQVQVQVGGVPGPGPGGGGPRSRSRLGGTQSQIQGGTWSQVQGGYLVSVKGKIFDTRFGLIHVQTRKKNFCRGNPPPQ